MKFNRYVFEFVFITFPGNKWQFRRKLLTQAFHFNIIKKYSKTFTEDADELLKVIDERYKNEQVNIIDLITKTTLKTICSKYYKVF